MVPAALLLAVITLAPEPQEPQSPDVRVAARSTTATATRATHAPSIDGRDDDAVWQSAQRVSDFTQFQPVVDADPRYRTEFRVSYDDRNLYVFTRMFDPHPDSIRHALTRRDVRGSSDQIKVMIDSYNDRRSGFEFAVNPDGVKRDYSMSNDGNEDDSWDGVWDVATSVDSLGWTAEFRIPLSQLRYAPAESNVFGFGVWRDIERHNEREAWPRYQPTRNGLSSQLGQLVGLAGITTARRVEVTPYVVTKNVQRIVSSGYSRNQEITGGGDIKIGITPNITLAATVNPDFGQVEADPSVVNLTAFETFFAERRPFFVEGTGLYQFQLNCYIVVDCSTNEGLFYSRRIGRSPSLRGSYGDESTPNATPIAAATKLTGRSASGLSFGVLDAVTQRVTGVGDATVEPLTNYGVLRAQQDLRGGEAGSSVIATAVNRSLDDLTSESLNRGAYTTGATFRNRFSGGRYELAGQFAGSFITGTPKAILLAQTNSVHYYQQPGDKLTVDSSRTSLGGHAEQLKFGKYGGGITRFETSLLRQSAGFEVNDLGYLQRADIVDWSTWAALSFRSAKWIYNWAQVNGNHWERWNNSGARLENAVNFNGHLGLKSNWDFHMGSTIGKLTESYCDRCTRGGPLLRQSRTYYPWAGFNSDGRKVLSYGFWYNGWFTDEGKSSGVSYSPYVNLRLSSRFTLNVGPGYSRDHNDSQWFGNFTDSGSSTTHYSFAHLEQRTVSVSARVSYTMSPVLTFEFYGQPFVSTGEYSSVRELSANPDAAHYVDRFQPYVPPDGLDMAFKYTQLRTNSVVRWEFRPGSTLFVVWAHGRDGSSAQYSNQSWSQDYRELFDLHPDNTFLIKVAYWLNR